LFLCGVNDATGGFQLVLRTPFTDCLLQPQSEDQFSTPDAKVQQNIPLNLSRFPHWLLRANWKLARCLPDISAAWNVPISDTL
jgi:hypothetical protein